jgi:SnoaL-like domain
MTVEELLAREEISDVIKRLARGTDRLDATMIESCYHADGLDDHNVFRGSGHEFAKWVLETLDVFDATMHFVGAPYTRLDGDVAQVDTYCVAHHIGRADEKGHATDLVLGLRYVDRFERRDGVWLIAKRVCAFDWVYRVPFNWSDRSWFAEDFTVGVRNRTDITYGGI